ncbi:Stt4p: phosphatidylinositol-4-kinase, partial [Mycena floridula]
LRECLYSVAYSWFAVRPQWTYGANRVQVDADIKLMSEFLSYLQTDSIRGSAAISSLSPVQTTSRNSHYAIRLRSINHPLKLLVENEIFRLTVWANPTSDLKRGADYVGMSLSEISSWTTVIRTTWLINPAIAIYLAERFKLAMVRTEVAKLVRSNTADVLDVPEALQFLLGERLDPSVSRDLKLLLLWAPVPPVIANTFFERRYNNDPLVLQYAHRVLEQHPVELTFFFVPQVVQALRYDDLGYVARFIYETAKISQLFCHQIIWNMKANCYKDDSAEMEDPMKPALDAMTNMVVDSLSGDARQFYDREFGFFHEVTSISGKLKPFIKKTKPEKKAKIDEEMAKITVDIGVYLPSNPDGKVVDIDKKSGRPLQSHAKAPFMATFKVRKERIVIDNDPELILDGDGVGVEIRTEYDVWQQAIFKVGDDCRQDVLALQIIAMFKNIFTSVGLTLYLFPYRVTATAPGCGVIDVVPNATSRDEMGRAKVNDLLDFFVAKYGGQDTIPFQQARLNFIQSMAAYSVACYILQIKDRHNGNIMIDGDGHIVHIGKRLKANLKDANQDFNGVKFEPHSFKLNHEMVVLMGGRYSQGYQLFQQLTVKAFLAIRPHAEQLISTVHLMLDTGLPSFKGEGTIKRLRERFALGLNERQAAEWMMSVIRNAHENVRSTAYDEFQRLQNGIPYK